MSSSTPEIEENNSNTVRNRSRSRSPIFRNFERNNIQSDLGQILDNIVNNLNIDNMPPHELKLEYLHILPEFHGEQALLSEFISTSEQLINRFYDNANLDNFQNVLLLKSIKNKIKGEAAVAISSYNINRWADLKTALYIYIYIFRMIF